LAIYPVFRQRLSSYRDSCSPDAHAKGATQTPHSISVPTVPSTSHAKIARHIAVTLLCNMLGHVQLLRPMQQSPSRRGVSINPLWALVWALILFIIFITVMAWSMSR
jgi:hypothetical protein